METLAQDKPSHGAAMGGMCTYTSLHPLEPQVTTEDRLKGRIMDLGSPMVPAVSIRRGYEAWSNGGGAGGLWTERDNSILRGLI